jgi:hypothetical protein
MTYDLDMTDIRPTIVAKSDQLNAEQLLGGPMKILVTAVRPGSDDKQPIIVDYQDNAGRPFKPCLIMRRLLTSAWGPDTTKWVGRSMQLYNDPTVTYGKEETGGVRISHLSHIDGELRVSLTIRKGSRKLHLVRPLALPACLQADLDRDLPKMQKVVEAGKKTAAQLLEAMSAKVSFTAAQRAQILALDTKGQQPQQVLKAEPATAEATDRGPAADDPRGGAMGAGQSAAADPAGDDNADFLRDMDAAEGGANVSTAQQ